MQVYSGALCFLSCFSLFVTKLLPLKPLPEFANSPCAISRAHGESHICRAQHQNHTAKKEHTSKAYFAVCRPQDTANPYFAVCPLCGTRRTSVHVRCQLTVVGCRTTPSGFTVCQGTAHGEHLSLPCASGQHTAKI